MEIVNHHLVDVCNNKSCKNIFSYNEINKVQKKYLIRYEKKYNNFCNGFKTLVDKEDELIHYYYLYFFIKYIQMSLHKNNNKFEKNNISSFYSSYSKEEIIKLLNKE